MHKFAWLRREGMLTGKESMVLFAGNTVWSISESVRGVREHVLYKSTLPLVLLLRKGEVQRGDEEVWGGRGKNGRGRDHLAYF